MRLVSQSAMLVSQVDLEVVLSVMKLEVRIYTAQRHIYGHRVLLIC